MNKKYGKVWIRVQRLKKKKIRKGSILMDNEYNNTNGSNLEGNNNEESSCYRYSASDIPKDDLFAVDSYREEEQSESSMNLHTETKEGSSSNEKKVRKNHKKTAAVVLKAVAFGLVASVVFLGANEVFYSIHPEKRGGIKSEIGGQDANSSGVGNGQEIATTTTTTPTVIHSEDVSKVVEETMPSIVAITSTVSESYSDWFGQQHEKEGEGSGSGIIVGKNTTELLIVTNNHVVEDAKSIGVTFVDTKVYKAEVKGTDRTADLAVIAVPLKSIKEETMKHIKIATLGNSDSIKVGQMAIAIGNALGYGQSTTVGYISAKERKVAVDNRTMTLLQTDAAINPGNSGGALLNASGEVIGINSVKYADYKVEGIGFAIPITRAMPIINDLMNREKVKEGEEGFLGVAGDTVEDSMVKGYGWPQGVYVKEVVKGGPAQEAGILFRDIITKINDTEVTSIEAMQERIFSLKAGTKVTVTVKRLQNGEFVEKKIEVTLKRRSDVIKEDNPQSSQSTEQAPGQIPDQTPNQTPGQVPDDQNPENGQNGDQEIPSDPFSEFFGEDGLFSIPGFGN